MLGPGRWTEEYPLLIRLIIRKPSELKLYLESPFSAAPLLAPPEISNGLLQVCSSFQSTQQSTIHRLQSGFPNANRIALLTGHGCHLNSLGLLLCLVLRGETTSQKDCSRGRVDSWRLVAELPWVCLDGHCWWGEYFLGGSPHSRSLCSAAFCHLPLSI